MDALRKAEEAKRAATQPDSPAATSASGTDVTTSAQVQADSATELSLEPMPTATDVHAAAPSADDAGKKKPAMTPSSVPNKPADQSQRSSVQNVFAAKSSSKKNNDRLFILALASVATLSVVGIGVYVWWQMQPRSGVGALPALATEPRLTLPTQPAPVTTVSPATSPPNSAPAYDMPAPASALSPPPSVPAARSPEPEARPYAPARLAERPVAASPIRVTHQSSRVNPLLEQGYNALQLGNLDQAQQAYDRMLASDPKSLDALYGLAAIAVSRQQNGLAENYYLRILELDPRDALAHAGLSSLNGRASGNTESRLKTLIAEQPNVAALHFALGNLYAQDQRWRDAQQAYFLAYKNDSEAPDIVFNLAISLDQLRQNKLAAQYYAEALRLTASHPGTFNRSQAQARLRELQSTLAP